MKKITIKFSGMGGNFDPEHNFVINILRKYFIVELSDDPDFLIYSVNSKDYLNYDCVRIFYTAENLVPDFNICDYAIGFHYISFSDRYFRYPIYLVADFNAYHKDNYGADLRLAYHKHEHADKELKEKTEFCAFVYSNREAAYCREKLFMKLSEYRIVNSGGRYLNNIGGTIDSKLNFQKKHKFVIAFENSSTPGYTTEKIVHAYAAGAVPIYWGDPDIEKTFNAGSFINCHAYGLTAKGEDEAIENIIKRVQELDRDDAAYAQMLSVPAFINDEYIEHTQNAFEEFLVHIFSQDKESAYRRNRLYWGERYTRKQRIGNSFYWSCRKIIPVRDFLKQRISVIKGWRHHDL